MPHGALTPLGRQLRVVLLALRKGDSIPNKSAIHTISRPHTITNHLNHRSQFPTGYSHESLDSNLNLRVVQSGDTEQSRHEIEAETQRPTRILKRHKRRNWVRDALSESGTILTKPSHRQEATDFSHSNPRASGFGLQYNANRARHRWDPVPSLRDTRELSVQRIVATYISNETEGANRQLTSRDLNFLQREGYSVDDIESLARIVSTPSPSGAVIRLQKRLSESNPLKTPAFIVNAILDRPVLPRQALRILIRKVNRLLEHYAFENLDTALILFIRLLRRARQTLPQDIVFVTQMLLGHLTRVTAGRDEHEQIARLTFIVNKSMKLVAAPTTVEPFKDADHQEAALAQILKYMAEHDPPLQVSREGYRAVVTVQLAQEMTPKERKWSRLKSLSWPPWKADRTNMDALITPEDGITRAGYTLIRMAAAGYSPLAWEKAAKLVAGWDTDGTPTIHNRSRHGFDASRVAPDAAIWVARIVATRTIQEAWAAFLAYEDTQLPLYPQIVLAIMERINEEGKLQSLGETYFQSDDQSNDILPGERREASPLPPSTHLYTYTRTAPPTFHGFMMWLENRRFVHDKHTMAFALAHVDSFQSGLHYVQLAVKRWPGVHDIINLKPGLQEIEDIDLDTEQDEWNWSATHKHAASPKKQTNADKVPGEVIAGLTKFLCRFPLNVMTASEEPSSYGTTFRGTFRAFISTRDRHLPKLEGYYTLRRTNTLVRAIVMLKQREITYVPAWNAVLQALVRVARVRPTNEDPFRSKKFHESGLPSLRPGPLVAYRLMEQTLTEMQRRYVEIDSQAFLSICRVAQSLTSHTNELLTMYTFSTDVEEKQLCHDLLFDGRQELLLQEGDHVSCVKKAFEDLVLGYPCDENSTSCNLDTASTEDILVIPSLAVLHAYIRVLGSAGAYDDLISLLRWITKHQHVITARSEKSRNQRLMMCRIVRAVSFYLRRSWVPEDSYLDNITTSNSEPDEKKDRCIALLRRSDAPASVETIAEARELVQSWEGWPVWNNRADKYLYKKDAVDNGDLVELRRKLQSS